MFYIHNITTKKVEQMYKLPLKITEKPHQGSPKIWVLYSEKHLKECIEHEGMKYQDWAEDQGYLVWEEDEDGDFTRVIDKTDEVDVYIEWLRHDLSSMEVEEITEEEAHKR